MCRVAFIFWLVLSCFPLWAASDNESFKKVKDCFEKKRIEVSISNFKLLPEEIAGFRKISSQCGIILQKLIGNAKKISFCAMMYNNFLDVGEFLIIADGNLIKCIGISDNAQSTMESIVVPIGTQHSALLKIVSGMTVNFSSQRWKNRIVCDGFTYFFYFNTPKEVEHAFFVPDIGDDETASDKALVDLEDFRVGDLMNDSMSSEKKVNPIEENDKIRTNLVHLLRMLRELPSSKKVK